MDRDAARQEITAQLMKRAAPKYRKLPITDDTEIYYDLRISGTDLYEFLVWIEKRFNVKFQIKFREYTPPEGWDPFFFRKWRLRRRPYKSLRIADVLTAIEAGHWPIDRAA